MGEGEWIKGQPWTNLGDGLAPSLAPPPSGRTLEIAWRRCLTTHRTEMKGGNGMLGSRKHCPFPKSNNTSRYLVGSDCQRNKKKKDRRTSESDRDGGIRRTEQNRGNDQAVRNSGAEPPRNARVLFSL